RVTPPATRPGPSRRDHEVAEWLQAWEHVGANLRFSGGQFWGSGMAVVRGAHLARLLQRWHGDPSANGARVPEYQALANAVGGLVREGLLELGARLPEERGLAQPSGISRTTVTSAYRELRGAGYLASRRGAGSWTTLPQGQRIGTSGVWMPGDEAGVIDLSTAALAAPPELA